MDLYIGARASDEVDEQQNLASEGINNGSKWPSMSYEQGVDAALGWVRGDYDDKPMSED